jgi:5-methylcytosine-specific restriction endonuclease McrA
LVGWKRGGINDGATCQFGATQVSGPSTRIFPIFVTEWEADHIIPLWRMPDGLPPDMAAKWHGLQNLQTLCIPCHRAKTARETQIRADLCRAASHA